jgi:hypothetical protein
MYHQYHAMLRMTPIVTERNVRPISPRLKP